MSGEFDDTTLVNDGETVPLAPPDAGWTGKTLGHFEVRDRIGAGGMGSVWLARDRSLGRDVALKILTGAHEPEFVERFVREARAQARLSHENVVPIYFIGEQDGCHYFAMEHVEGETLTHRIRGEGPIAWAESLEILRGVVRGLEHAANRGLIHRDIKPSNILLTESNTPKVADFGIAKLVDSLGDLEAVGPLSDSALTQAGAFVGTADYAAPEQILSADVDQRTDMYALGATLFSMLTTKRVFEGASPVEVLRQHLTAEPDFTRLPGDTPIAVRAMLSRLLAKQPDDRYATYEDLTQAIRAALPRTEPPVHVSGRLLAGLLDLTVLQIMTALAQMVFPGFDAVLTTLAISALYVILAAFARSTVGQWVLGHEIVATDTTPAPIGRHLVRSVCFLVPIGFAAAGYLSGVLVLMTFGGALLVFVVATSVLREDQRALNDVISGTRVLQLTSRRPATWVSRRTNHPQRRG